MAANELLWGDDMARRTARKRTKTSRKASKKSLKAVKKPAKAKAAATKTATKRIARRSDLPIGGQTQRDPTEERFRELVAWYVLEGVDKTTARQRARQEMDSDLRKDRRR
jgi:hypothetical protein